MNKKGQALVEFIIIFPILIMFVMAIFDLVNIQMTKIKLENTLTDYILDDSSVNLEKISIKIDDKNYFAQENIEIISPLLHPILKDNYNVIVKRSLS